MLERDKSFDTLHTEKSVCVIYLAFSLIVPNYRLNEVILRLWFSPLQIFLLTYSELPGDNYFTSFYNSFTIIDCVFCYCLCAILSSISGLP